MYPLAANPPGGSVGINGGRRGAVVYVYAYPVTVFCLKIGFMTESWEKIGLLWLYFALKNIFR